MKLKVNKRVILTFISLGIIVGSMTHYLSQLALPAPNTSFPSDNSILTEQPCALPCWYGFIPGESSLATVKSTIDTIPLLVKTESADERTVLGDYYVGRSYFNAFGVSFRFKKDLLYSLKIRPNISYTLQDILDLYGIPAGVTTEYWPDLVDPQTNRMDSETLYLQLYYPKAGLIVTVNIYGGKQGQHRYEIRPDAKGEEFYIYPASQTLEQLVTYQIADGSISTKATIHFMFKTEWSGLYSVIIDPSPAMKPPVTPNIQPLKINITPTP